MGDRTTTGAPPRERRAGAAAEEGRVFQLVNALLNILGVVHLTYTGCMNLLCFPVRLKHDMSMTI